MLLLWTEREKNAAYLELRETAPLKKEWKQKPVPAIFFPEEKKNVETGYFPAKDSDKNKAQHCKVLESAVSLSKQTLTNRSFVGSRWCWQ